MEGGDILGKKRRKKNCQKSTETVNDLKVGKGTVVLGLRKTNKKIMVEGAIVLKGAVKNLVVPSGNRGNSGDCCRSYGSGIRVISVENWQEEPRGIPLGDDASE